MTVIEAVKLSKCQIWVLILNVSKSLKLLFFHQETTPESTIKVVDASYGVRIANCFQNRADDIAFLLGLAFAAIHRNPSVTKLFNIVRISLAIVVLHLLGNVVSKLYLSVVFSFQVL